MNDSSKTTTSIESKISIRSKTKPKPRPIAQKIKPDIIDGSLYQIKSNINKIMVTIKLQLANHIRCLYMTFVSCKIKLRSILQLGFNCLLFNFSLPLCWIFPLPQLITHSRLRKYGIKMSLERACLILGMEINKNECPDLHQRQRPIGI
jgi:hypothetical protein